MIDIYVRRGERVPLGREGTRGVRRVIFDSTRWVREYGEGVVQLIVQRPGESQPYPIALIYEDDTAIWEVNSADTAIPGEGKCEWQYYVGDKLEKSEIYTTVIVDSLADPTDEAPDRYDIWMEALLEVASEAEKHKRGAETARQGAETAAAAAAGSRDGAAAQAAAASKSAQSAAQSEAAALEAEEKVVTLVTKAVKPEWPSVQYRPVEYESIGDTITWDGNEEGMIACTFPVWFLVAPLTDEDVEKIRANPELFEQGVAVDQDGTERGFDKAEENRLRYDKECVLVVLEENLVLVNDIVFPYKGVYFFSGSQSNSNSGVSVNIKTASFTVPGFEFHREIIKPIAVPYAVSTKPQALTEAQQMQARKNLGLPYSGNRMVEVLAECQPVFVEDESSFALYEAVPVTVGEEYTVVWNGVEYVCTAQPFEMDGVVFAMLGNMAAFGGTGGEDYPFTMLFVPADMVAAMGAGAMFMPLDGSTALTLAIYQDGETIHKLDNKYIDAEWMATIKEGKGELIADKHLSSQERHLLPEKKYLVIYDGVEYECKAVVYNEIAVFMGNLAWMGMSSNGEPFYVMDAQDSDFEGYFGLGVYDVETQKLTNAEYAIYPIEEIPDPLPEKFLPDSVVTYTAQSLTDEEKAQARANIGVSQPDWNQNDATAPDYIKNRPFYKTDDGEVVKIDEGYLPTGGTVTDEQIASAVEAYLEENPVEHPDTLPNPNSLTIKQTVGGVSQSWKYDGTEKVSFNITIPTVPTNISAFTNDSGYQTAEKVTAIVQEQLGVIENGTY